MINREKVKHIMTKDPACCIEDTSLQDIAEMMCEYNCGEIPVVDNQNKPIGVVTDRDIVCRAIAQGKNALELTARDCMTSPCVTVTPEMSLDQCCEIMEEHQIRRVPVVDEEGQCCGIVAQADIALNVSKDKTAEVLKEVSKAA